MAIFKTISRGTGTGAVGCLAADDGSRPDDISVEKKERKPNNPSIKISDASTPHKNLGIEGLDISALKSAYTINSVSKNGINKHNMHLYSCLSKKTSIE
jgi:hypothetical protein